VDIPSSKSSAIESRIALKNSSGAPWKKFVAFAVVAVMVAAGFVMIAPALKSNLDKSTQTAPTDNTSQTGDNTAQIAIGGTHYNNFTASNMLESYVKVRTSTGSYRSDTLGLNNWWERRQIKYGDIEVRTSYPFVIGYNAYSAEYPISGSAVPTLTYGLYSFYRVAIDSPSLTTISTGPNMPLRFVPILSTQYATNDAMSGGWVNWSYYLDYMTNEDISDALNGTGYWKSYYGMDPSQLHLGGINANDGWFIDFQGKVEYNRAAAKKFLNLTGSASLITQFNANNTGANLGKMNTTWSNYWLNDGSGPSSFGAGGPNDIYAGYDFDLAYSGLDIFLTVDMTASNANKLVLRVGCIGYGLEILMCRYLDRAGVQSKLESTPEDFYLNGTASPSGAEIHCRYVATYNIVASRDTGFYSPAWLLDILHLDYTTNTALHPATLWTSRYAGYQPPKNAPWPLYTTYSPGTLTFGKGVAYYYPPMNWSLLANEKIVIKLPSQSKSAAGYMPYVGTGAHDTLDGPKQTELANNLVWGEIGLGNCYGAPYNLRSATYYNHATKTLTLTGPMTFNRNQNAAFPRLNATGAPSFQFDLMRVSDYTMAIQEAGPYVRGQTYHLTMTAKSNLGATVTDWNGTIDLTATAGTTLGASTLWFGPGSNGVVSTTMTFTTNGSKTITATDRNNSLDVVHSIPVMVGPFTLNLAVGWNFVTVPLVGQGYKASTIGLATGDMISSWAPATQKYDKTYIKGISPPVLDFTIAPNVGYWIWVSSPRTLTLTGIIPISAQSYVFTVPSLGGWIALGFESMKTTGHARDIPVMYSGSGAITLIAYYNAATGKYVSWISALPAVNNFVLNPGVAYWCWVTQGTGGTITYVP
jgi:hypothetical protein